MGKKSHKIIVLLLSVVIFVPFKNYTAQVKDKIEVGIEERQGKYLPMDAEFVTSENDTVALKNIINKPFLLDVGYYNCPGICHPLLSELSWAVDRIKMNPGTDFQVVFLSFDPKEDYTIAQKWKKSYLKGMKRKMPPNSWYFLSGDSVNIKKITDAVGFDYRPNGRNFIHAGSVESISADGKISRYIYGSTFNPFDLKMALIDAQNDEVRPTSAKLLQLCFSYDPSGRKYSLNVTRIVGALMILGLFSFFIVVVFKKKKKDVI